MISNVTQMTEILNIPQSTVSQHLSKKFINGERIIGNNFDYVDVYDRFIQNWFISLK